MAIRACNRFLPGNGSFSGLLRHVGQSVDCHKLVINLVVPEVGIRASSIDWGSDPRLGYSWSSPAHPSPVCRGAVVTRAWALTSCVPGLSHLVVFKILKPTVWKCNFCKEYASVTVHLCCCWWKRFGSKKENCPQQNCVYWSKLWKKKRFIPRGTMMKRSRTWGEWMFPGCNSSYSWLLNIAWGWFIVRLHTPRSLRHVADGQLSLSYCSRFVLLGRQQGSDLMQSNLLLLSYREEMVPVPS